jgi:hypothetical protein
MIHRANMPDEHRHLLFGKAIKLDTQMDGLVLEEINGALKTRVEHATGKLPSNAHNMRTWGEAGVVKQKTATTPKILNKGTACVFVGYPENHGSGTYLMYNPQTKGVHTTRDVVFLRRMYWSKKGPDYKEVSVNVDTDVAIGASEVGESKQKCEYAASISCHDN